MGADPAREFVRAWRPSVAGVGEVLHAHFTAHAYPAHTHDHWTLLLVDTGGVAYDLDRHAHLAEPRTLTVLPPHVPHDGRAARAEGFDKRVLYVDERWLPADLIGAAVGEPRIRDAAVVARIGRLHGVLSRPGDELEAESLLALATDRIAAQLARREPRRDGRAPGLARLVRDRLDVVDEPPTLEALAAEHGVHPSQLVRAFHQAYGLPPHRYLTGRRVDRARRLLLDGMPAADVAANVGFHDQSHLIRHFRRVLGVTPGAFAGRAA
ncbi:AraC family transcriptional regulator [Pseudolysinimonas sp.]|jgi:AraC-like DNA-binding protein|uniref:AraC family transcriptional regulator n=1 Tax=Pseudolysinimonas sp. TaxID=2680009 RepID=UPI0037847275